MSDKFMMDGHKLLWHLDRVLEWQQGKRVPPLHIDFGITTGCNMACSYCYGVIQGRTTQNKRFDMPREAVVRLMHDAKDLGVRSIAYIGEGENTLNGALYDGLMAASEVKLDVSLATNGIQFNQERLFDMLSSLVWIRFNISAATPESYFKIHGVRLLPQVLNNIRRCVEMKERFNLPVTIGIQMVVVRENMNDIVPLAALGRELGVDYLVVKPCSDTNEGVLDAPVEKYQELESVFQAAEACSTETFSVNIKRAKMSNLGLKDFGKCFGTQFIIGISGDGTVYPCGHFFNIRSDEFAMGNVISSSLTEIVNSERYWDVQRKISELDVNKECETNCRQYYVSQFLWKLHHPPNHLNFI